MFPNSCFVSSVSSLSIKRHLQSISNHVTNVQESTREVQRKFSSAIPHQKLLPHMIMHSLQPNLPLPKPLWLHCQLNSMLRAAQLLVDRASPKLPLCKLCLQAAVHLHLPAAELLEVSPAVLHLALQVPMPLQGDHHPLLELLRQLLGQLQQQLLRLLLQDLFPHPSQ